MHLRYYLCRCLHAKLNYSQFICNAVLSKDNVTPPGNCSSLQVFLLFPQCPSLFKKECNKCFQVPLLYCILLYYAVYNKLHRYTFYHTAANVTKSIAGPSPLDSQKFILFFIHFHCWKDVWCFLRHSGFVMSWKMPDGVWFWVAKGSRLQTHPFFVDILMHMSH